MFEKYKKIKYPDFQAMTLQRINCTVKYIFCAFYFSVIPSKEIYEQMKFNLRTSIYCKIRLVVYMVQDELRNKSAGTIHNELIMQWEG